jgi:phage FluMu protein Com
MKAYYKHRTINCFVCGKLTTQNPTGKCPECQTPEQLKRTGLSPANKAKSNFNSDKDFKN